MFSRISNAWSLAKSSWAVLQKDRELAWLPVIGGVAALVVAALFFVILLEQRFAVGHGQRSHTRLNLVSGRDIVGGQRGEILHLIHIHRRRLKSFETAQMLAPNCRDQPGPRGFDILQLVKGLPCPQQGLLHQVFGGMGIPAQPVRVAVQVLGIGIHQRGKCSA